MKQPLIIGLLYLLTIIAPGATRAADPHITCTGSVTSWDGSSIKGAAGANNAELRIVLNNLSAPTQVTPIIAPAVWVYLWLPPALAVDTTHPVQGVYTMPFMGWTLLYLAQPALNPMDSHQWMIPLISTADGPGELFSFTQTRWGGWVLNAGTRTVTQTPNW